MSTGRALLSVYLYLYCASVYSMPAPVLPAVRASCVAKEGGPGTL